MTEREVLFTMNFPFFSDGYTLSKVASTSNLLLSVNEACRTCCTGQWMGLTDSAKTQTHFCSPSPKHGLYCRSRFKAPGSCGSEIFFLFEYLKMCLFSYFCSVHSVFSNSLSAEIHRLRFQRELIVTGALLRFVRIYVPLKNK